MSRKISRFTLRKPRFIVKKIHKIQQPTRGILFRLTGGQIFLTSKKDHSKKVDLLHIKYIFPKNEIFLQKPIKIEVKNCHFAS